MVNCALAEGFAGRCFYSRLCGNPPERLCFSPGRVREGIKKVHTASGSLRGTTQGMHRSWNFSAFLHVSGERLIEERVDEGSREHARSFQGPACGPVLLDIVKGFATEQGWSLTIDFFASACNHVTERYMSWTADSNCVWLMRLRRAPGMYHCVHGANDHIGKRDSSSLHYGLEDKVVRRARSDGVQAIFLVPVNQRAPFFQALQQHAAASLEVAADRDGVFKNTQGRQMAKHMLFAVDFGGPDRAAPWCVQGFVRRAPGRIPRPVEAAESEALLAKLSFLATGLPGCCCTFAS